MCWHIICVTCTACWRPIKGNILNLKLNFYKSRKRKGERKDKGRKDQTHKSQNGKKKLYVVDDKYIYTQIFSEASHNHVPSNHLAAQSCPAIEERWQKDIPTKLRLELLRWILCHKYSVLGKVSFFCGDLYFPHLGKNLETYSWSGLKIFSALGIFWPLYIYLAYIWILEHFW